MKSALVLWDVDNTLIANGGVSKENYMGAFELLTGRRCEHRPRTGGRTDPLILADLFADHGLDVTAELSARFPEAMEAAMAQRRGELARRGRELPGARAGLAAVAGLGQVVQSVLTGNVRANGHAKVEVFDLAGYLDFEVGGYGSDDGVRANLVGFAQRRAGAKYGTVFTRDSTVLIGDTPNDVRAGLNGGAKVLAVASGSDSEETLRGVGADAVLPSLADTELFVTTLLGLLAA